MLKVLRYEMSQYQQLRKYTCTHTPTPQFIQQEQIWLNVNNWEFSALFFELYRLGILEISRPLEETYNLLKINLV